MSSVLGPSCSISTHNHAPALAYTGAELWMTHWHWDDTFVTSLHLYKVRLLSLSIPTRVHVLSLDICSGVHDGPERWCLTAADTKSRLRGCWQRTASTRGPWRGTHGADELVCGQNVGLLYPQNLVFLKSAVQIVWVPSWIQGIEMHTHRPSFVEV